ncbi:hypothetical protein Tco_1185193 [Tanacetum coccineum]
MVVVTPTGLCEAHVEALVEQKLEYRAVVFAYTFGAINRLEEGGVYLLGVIEVVGGLQILVMDSVGRILSSIDVRVITGLMVRLSRFEGLLSGFTESSGKVLQWVEHERRDNGTYYRVFDCVNLYICVIDDTGVGVQSREMGAGSFVHCGGRFWYDGYLLWRGEFVGIMIGLRTWLIATLDVIDLSGYTVYMYDRVGAVVTEQGMGVVYEILLQVEYRGYEGMCYSTWTGYCGLGVLDG